MRVLRWAKGSTKKDHIKSEDILRAANIEPMKIFLGQKPLRWYSQLLREEGMLNMQVRGKRRRGTTKKIWLANIRDEWMK